MSYYKSNFGYFRDFSASSLMGLREVNPRPKVTGSGGGECLVYDSATSKFKVGTLTGNEGAPTGTTLASSRDESFVTYSGTSNDVIVDSYILPSAAIFDGKFRQRIQNIEEPVAAGDLGTKNYADNKVAGVTWKTPVSAVSTAVLVLNGAAAPADVDNVVLADGNRVLVTQQADPVTNGVYLYNSAGAWTRATDFGTGIDIKGFAVSVEQGTLYENKSFICTVIPAVVGTDPLQFGLFSEIAKAGAALQKTNDVMDVVVDTASVQVQSDQLVSSIFPAGTIIRSPALAVSGYLKCDGTAYDRTTYAALFAVLNAVLSTATISIASPAELTMAAAPAQASTIYLTTDGALPTGLSENTTYFVFQVNATTIRLADSLANLEAGVFIDTTGAQSGTHTVNTSVGGVSDAVTFNVPDLRGKVLAMPDATYGSGSQIGDTGTITLTEDQMPAHTHPADPADYTHSHSFDYLDYQYSADFATGTDQQIFGDLNDTRSFTNSNFTLSVVNVGETSGTAGGSSGVSDPTGSAQSFSVAQPTFFINSFIKT